MREKRERKREREREREREKEREKERERKEGRREGKDKERGKGSFCWERTLVGAYKKGKKVWKGKRCRALERN